MKKNSSEEMKTPEWHYVSAARRSKQLTHRGEYGRLYYIHCASKQTSRFITVHIFATY